MFRFRFATLLKVRKIRNDEAQQALANAQRAYNTLLDERDACQTRIDGAGDELLTMFRRAVTPTEVRMFYDYQHYLLERINVLGKEIEQAAREVEQKREQLMKARKELKAIERLKEIHSERYHIEQERLEMKVIDEMAVTRYARQQ